MTPHVIETLQWDCRFDRKDLALAQQERLIRFLKGPGLRIVAELFERISPATEVWRIDRLEVDLGRLDANASLEQWGAQLQEQLWTCLQRQRREGSADIAASTPTRALLSPSDRDLDVFIHYLEQGHLPWSANLAEARDLADWLARMAQRHGLRLWQRLQQALQHLRTGQRLCHISPHSGLQALIEVRHPDLADSLMLLDRELLAPLHASGRISAYQQRQLQQSYRVAGLHALWGLSGSALSAARRQALQQALLQAHRDWLAPSWSPAWRSSLARASLQSSGPSTGGDLAHGLLQALLGEPSAVEDDPVRLQAVLDGSSPLDSVRLAELLDRLQALKGPAQSRLGRALRMLARNQARRLDWARQLGPMQVWQLIQLMQPDHQEPTADAAGQGVTEAGSRQAAWLAASSWSESLRQFALRMNSAAPWAVRPGLSRLQSQLMGYSLRHLAQHGRLPQDHVAWQALWQQAWIALHGDPQHRARLRAPDHPASRLTQQALAETPTGRVRQPAVFAGNRLRDARSRWQLVTTATDATLLACLGSCVGCPPSQLTWFETGVQASAKAFQSPSVPARQDMPWVRSLLWSFALGLLSAEASPSQSVRARIESQVQAHWTSLLAVITQALPSWWRGRTRTSDPGASDPPAALNADLQARTARYLGSQAWSCVAPGGPARQIEASRNALLKLWPRWARAWLAANPQESAALVTSRTGAPCRAPEPPPIAMLDALLSRPVATLQSGERLKLAELLQTDAACARWLAMHDETQRWAWLHAQFGREAARLRPCSDSLLLALRITCPQLTAQQAHALHWRHLAQHLFVEGLPPEPGLLARRYTMRLCQRDHDLTGAASQSWQRWLHRMHQALQRPPAVPATPALAATQAVAAMREALKAPPMADEQWEASLSPAQRAAPLAGLDAAPNPEGSQGRAQARPPQPAFDPDPIYTPTAGLVLLGAYVQRAFATLQLTANSKFIDEAARIHAVHCLEYLAWGTTESAEPAWVLSKMLCGVPLAQPLPPCDGIDSPTRELLDGMLMAVIGHWKTIGNTSVAGLRQSFLQRAGRLTRKPSDLDDQWQLTVEPRAFDMLLDRLPWPYSTIKLPWMAGALHVDWR